eukprot:768781-Hanusia_phi.AAC.3
MQRILDASPCLSMCHHILQGRTTEAAGSILSRTSPVYFSIWPSASSSVPVLDPQSMLTYIRSPSLCHSLFPSRPPCPTLPLPLPLPRPLPIPPPRPISDGAVSVLLGDLLVSSQDSNGETSSTGGSEEGDAEETTGQGARRLSALLLPQFPQTRRRSRARWSREDS